MKLFEKEYCDESFWQDVEGDMYDISDSRLYEEIPDDEDGHFKRGTFKVTVEWIDEKSN